jgi:LPS export ABC transporter protein LptC
MKGVRVVAVRRADLQLLALLLAGAACGQPTAETGTTADPSLTSMDADFVTYGMDSNLTTEGVRSGRVHADTAFFYETSTEWRMHGVRMTVFNEQGVDQATVVADSGELNEASQQMVARGNVAVELPNSSCQIETSELHYDPINEQIRSEQPSLFRQGGRTLTTAGFTSDLRFENFTFRQPVGPANICARAGGP